MTEEEINYFTIEEGKQENDTQDFFHLSEIVVKLDQNEYKFERSIFTFWSLLGEIGGLSGALTSVFALIASIFTFNKPQNAIARHLYV